MSRNVSSDKTVPCNGGPIMKRAFGAIELMIFVCVVAILIALALVLFTEEPPKTAWPQGLKGSNSLFITAEPGDLIELSRGGDPNLRRQTAEILRVTDNGVTVLWHGHTFLVPEDELVGAEVTRAYLLTTIQKMGRLSDY